MRTELAKEEGRLGYWRKSRVLELCGISKSTLDRLVRSGDFPKPVKLGPRAIGWKVSDVIDWIDSREQVSYED